MSKKFEYISESQKPKCIDDETKNEIKCPEDGFIIKGEIYTADMNADGTPVTQLFSGNKTVSKESLLKLLGYSKEDLQFYLKNYIIDENELGKKMMKTKKALEEWGVDTSVGITTSQVSVGTTRSIFDKFFNVGD